MSERSKRRGGVSRRAFVMGGAGAAVGASLAIVGKYGLPAWKAFPGFDQGGTGPVPSFSGAKTAATRSGPAMPGPYPGRVIEVRHPGAVEPLHHRVDSEAVRKMMARGMCELTDADHPTEAWRHLFEPGDVVGIKINPVGRRPNKGERKRQPVGSVSSAEILLETVAGLKSAGVKARDIIVFERYANEFRVTKFNGTDCGYEELMRTRAMDGCRWLASSAQYDDFQTELDGLQPGRKKSRDPHVTGYDPDVFVTMGFAVPEADPRDERRFRSHLSLIVTRMVNKVITIPVLKDHRSSGVTLCLKNLSHGMNNNVCRSHLEKTPRRFADEVSMPNQCNTFIPLAAGQQPLREKATLHVMDGLIGVYEGGPKNDNPTWGTWRRNSLFFGTDPVAMDHVGWDLIDRKRAAEGWPPVATMSNVLTYAPVETLSARLAVLAAQQPTDALTLAAAAQRYRPHVNPNELDRRQPEHVILSSTVGLGVFDARQIDHRTITLPT